MELEEDMKFKVKATVVFEWEEDTDNWPDQEPTEEGVLKGIRECDDQISYILDGEYISYTIEVVKAE